jgi:hypothetical protein
MSTFNNQCTKHSKEDGPNAVVGTRCLPLVDDRLFFSSKKHERGTGAITLILPAREPVTSTMQLQASVHGRHEEEY